MMKKIPTVSVILPTYNRAHLIGRAIQSVLAQTYHDFELIIIDDGSTDNTRSVIEDFDDDRIVYIKHEQNKGVAAARNTGIATVKGKYIAFLDSDDQWMPGKLASQIDILANTTPDIGVVVSGYIWIKGSNKVYLPEQHYVRQYLNEPSSGVSVILTLLQTSLVKKECFEKVGLFDEQLRTSSDTEMIIRLARHYTYLYVEEPLAIILDVSGNLTSNKKTLAYYREKVIEKHYNYIEKYPILLGWLSFNTGRDLCACGDMSKGRKYLIKAVEAQPSNIKYYGALLSSVAGSYVFNKAIEISVKLQHLANSLKKQS